MNRFLRTASTKKLLAAIAAAIAAVAIATTIAVAATSGGPVPPSKPLAVAIHDALASKSAPAGITADISFTNKLIDSSDIIGADPILTGASGRLWLGANHQVRIELQGNSGDAQILVSGGSFWIYDPTANTVYKGTIPGYSSSSGSDKGSSKSDGVPTLADIENTLNHLAQKANLSGAIPGDQAGQAAYTVRISPKHDGGLLGAGELAFDAARGIPLRIAVYAAGAPDPVLDLEATNIDYGAVDPSIFKVSPPAGAHVVNVSPASTGAASDAAGKHIERKHGINTVAHLTPAAQLKAIAAKLAFKLDAPATLSGLPRQSVSLVDFGARSKGALVTYGQNLGGILVLEQPASSGGTSLNLTAGGDHHHGLSLPTVSLGGVTGSELDTALGTMVRFTRGNVSYTVLGSVPPAAADAAARAL
jgi:outer membrane lipoprotein-sorting protein